MKTHLALLTLICTVAINLNAIAITVTTTNDAGPGSLRAALASAADGDTIDASGVSGTITLTTGELVVSNNVTILGPGPANLAVDGNFPNTTNRVFHIGSNTVVAISGLTITNGSADNGGGILNDHATLTVSNSTLSGSFADFGGGIFNDGHSNDTATLTVANSTLSGNSAVFRGGGVYNWGANGGNATLQIVNSTLDDNSADVGGGGIYNDHAALTVSNVTLSGNAANFGGGIFNNGQAGDASLQIGSSTLSGNSATSSGGGIYNDSASGGTATLTITSSTLSDNSAITNGGAIYYFGASTGSPTQQVVNCTLSGNSAGARGGGIFNDGQDGGASLQIGNSTLSSNAATFGGGIYNDGFSGSAALTITNSTLSGNSADINGGGIFNDGESGGTATVEIASSTLGDNSADFGGGIYNDGEHGSARLEITSSILSSNSAVSDGGVIYNDGKLAGSATLQIANSTLIDNSSGGDGGVILNDGTENGTATVEITASLLTGNSSTGSFGGGAIYNWGVGGNATLQIANSTLTSNSAVFGGAIFNDGAGQCCVILQIANSTLTGNSADLGGGIYNDGSNGGSATLEIGSTILNAGASGGTFTNDSGTFTSRGYNLSSDDGGGVLTNATDQINTDPLLGPLQDNGGPTFTHALLCGSPAIDQGKNLSASATDQRGGGFARTFDDPSAPNATGGDGTDIGAFELQAFCCFSIDPTNAAFNASGGIGGVMVTASATGCIWTASTNDGFITITDGTNGVGNGTVNYSVAANASASPRTGTMSIAGQTFTVNQGGMAPPVPHDLALVSIHAPKHINLKAATPALTKRVKVQIQNLSAHEENISSLATLANLVTVQVTSIGTNCTPPAATLINGPPNKPKILKPNKKLNVFFNVSYDCANDRAKGVGHEDYSYTATVHHDALGTGNDTVPANDVCPRAASGSDKGCVPVTTDVVVK